MSKCGLCCRPVSVVRRLSVTFVYCIQTAEPEDIVKLISRSSRSIVFFLIQSAHTQFQREPLQRERKIHGVGEILRFSTEITVCLGNGTR